MPAEVLTKREALQAALLGWYADAKRDLPWRRSSDPYRIWLAEVILQQTRVDQGTPYYERIVERYPTVKALAAAREEDVLKLWEGLGYYSRARNLHKAARCVAEEYGGEFPSEAAVLRKLPGIGPYTAGAIASIAFGKPEPILDGNVARVLARIFHVAGNIDETAGKRILWRIAGELVPQESPGDFNQALMELGARICTPVAPNCEACPAASICQARAKGLQVALPVRRARKRTPHHEMVAAVIGKRGRYLLARRPGNGLLGGLWEFPCGRVKSGESHKSALQRMAQETVGVGIEPRGLLSVVNHAYSHFRITLNVYRCNYLQGSPVADEYTEVKWLPKSQFTAYPLPKTVLKFLDLI